MTRVALVTGGTRGIGAAIASSLHGDGYRVAAVYARDDEAAERFREQSGVAVYKWDVGDFKQCQDGIARVEAEIGRVEILVNNAGITRDGTLHRMAAEQWQDVLDTNLGSCFNMCRCVIETMRAGKFGRIVNIGSINGQAGQYGQVNYAAAKSGIHGFTKALAQEGAKFGITVNAVAPGYVDTDMVRAVPENVLEKIIASIPVGRLGRAGDIARTVKFLIADDADFITGSTISVNGGHHMY
ncbi:MAG: acetoacetyl-CoA reductase [Alphaproteobacteria bacterium]|jgi:acetoacetyl-CoA reductase|nr:acetoacetyl-CoA reductase [Alphaproteobacteria bacterium]|tara:strand:- start:29 stop:751 length:723 start_codon:yes stop_codon:yes gene_type:complete